MAPPSDRRALLESLAIDEGRRWARALRQSLMGEGRRIAGGWPGTLSEARCRAVAGCGREVRALGLAELTTVEIEWMARRLNAAARLDWLSKAEREDAAEG